MPYFRTGDAVTEPADRYGYVCLHLYWALPPTAYQYDGRLESAKKS